MPRHETLLSDSVTEAMGIGTLHSHGVTKAIGSALPGCMMVSVGDEWCVKQPTIGRSAANIVRDLDVSFSLYRYYLIFVRILVP